ILTNQYNANVANQQGAANSLLNGSNTSAGLQAGLQQQAVNNQNTGINNVGTALNNSTYGPQTILAAQELGQQLPAQNLGLLANIGIPLAQLGTNATGSSTTTSNPSLLQDFATAAGGLGSLFGSPKGGASAASGIGSALAGAGSAASSGLSGLLGLL